MTDITTISINKKTRDRIAVHGKYGQTIDEILIYILDMNDAMANRIEQLENNLSS